MNAVQGTQEKLDAAVLKTYGELSEAEIKTLAVDGKWFASIQVAIAGEVTRITQALAERLRELDERYARSLPGLNGSIELLSARVEEHLRQMGVPLT